MATSFAPQPQPIHHSPTYMYNHQSNYGNSTTPPSNNVSPTNHSSANYQHAKQVRQPKQPLYIPAVLRPTEMPISRQASLTPPRSAHSSMDLSRDGLRFGSASTCSLPASPEEDDNRSYGPWGPGSITRVVSDEWSEDSLGSVTGAPTRNHWKPDNSTSLCTSPTCARPFSLFARRHHCRRCGNIFCSSHSPHAVPLDQEARFHPEGTLQRSCDNCWADYRTWRNTRDSRNNSVTSRDSNETALTKPVGVPGQNMDTQEHQPVGSVAQSVGGNWNWSTF